jgi:flagellin-like hook-associated protein FlgL
MTVGAIGPRSTLSIQRLVDMRRQLDELQRQLGTGQKSDTYAGLGIERGLTVGLRTRLSLVGGFNDTITNVGVRLSIAQTALTRMSDIGRDIKSTTVQSPLDLDAGGQTISQKLALGGLGEILALLNTQSGDRYLFSGLAADKPAVESLDRILDGDGARAGFRQVMAERRLADLGADGLGRLVIPAPAPGPAQIAGFGATLTPDAPGVVTGTQNIGGAFTSAGGNIVINGTAIVINAGDDATAIQAAINAQVGTTGVGATLNGSNQLVLTGVDADTSVDIGAGTSAGLLSEFGIAVGVASHTNLLTQGAVTAGQTLTVTVGANPTLTVVFGNGVGEVSTLGELNAALGALVGGTASVNLTSGNITVTAGNNTDAIAIGGTATPANFGIPVLSAAPADATVSLGEDAAGSPFGIKLSSVSSTLTGAAVAGPVGSPPAITIGLLSNPLAGETVQFSLSLPDGSSETLTLTATASATLGVNQFTIGATPDVTATNLQAALMTAVGKLARTSLTAASALAAAQDFFAVDAATPPRRADGPPFETATALVAGTPADTVTWYIGEAGPASARSTAMARVDQAIAVSYGLRANEEGIRWVVQNMAALAAMTYASNDPDAADRNAALNQRVTAALSGPAGVQKIEHISADLAGAQKAAADAGDRHLQTTSALTDLLQDIEGVPTEEVAAQILALQTRLQASLQTTALLYQSSLVYFL